MKTPHTHPEGFPPHPNLDKMGEVELESRAITEFLDWLFTSKKSKGAGYVLAYWGDSQGWDEENTEAEAYKLWQARPNWEEVLREYFEIDSVAAENERTALLEWQRRLNEGGAPLPAEQDHEAPDV